MGGAVAAKGSAPKITDAELLTLSVMHAVEGCRPSPPESAPDTTQSNVYTWYTWYRMCQMYPIHPVPSGKPAVAGTGRHPHPIRQRILALTATIWHNDHTGQPIKRALVAYDH